MFCVGVGKACVVAPAGIRRAVISAGKGAPIVVAQVAVEAGGLQKFYKEFELLAFAAGHGAGEVLRRV